MKDGGKVSKIYYDNLSFDSEWEKEYYIYLRDVVKAEGIWRDLVAIKGLMGRDKYTPDFIYLKDKVFHIVEVKGNYNPYANHFQDDMIHREMKTKNQQFLRYYVANNGISTYFDNTFVYEKIKKLKAHGWVDYEWKNPNTLSNQRKAKITELEQSMKEINKRLKDYERFVDYVLKIQDGQKLTKQQREWYMNFIKEHKKWK